MKEIKEEVSLCRDYLRSAVFDQQSSFNITQVTQHPNPLARYGRQMFSQAFEDGITLEIIKRSSVECKNETFLEIGCGNGTQNNTLALAALGWEGVWVDAGPLYYKLPEESRVIFFQRKVNRETALSIALDSLPKLKCDQYDVISIDVDGIDYHIVKEMLKNNVKPQLWIVEYNALFLPPVEFIMDYDPNHSWDNTSYYGASLESFVGLMKEYGYWLVCCTPAIGTNAFFVRKELFYAYTDVPDDIEDIYVGPHYRLDINFGHPIGIRLIQHLLDKTKTYQPQTEQA